MKKKNKNWELKIIVKHLAVSLVICVLAYFLSLFGENGLPSLAYCLIMLLGFVFSIVKINNENDG